MRKTTENYDNIFCTIALSKILILSHGLGICPLPEAPLWEFV